MIDPIIGAAVYFDPAKAEPVNTNWLDGAISLLARARLPVREFETVGSPTFDQVLRAYPPNASLLGRPSVSNRFLN